MNYFRSSLPDNFTLLSGIFELEGFRTNGGGCSATIFQLSFP
jgi:hypothetical protein